MELFTDIDKWTWPSMIALKKLAACIVKFATHREEFEFGTTYTLSVECVFSPGQAKLTKTASSPSDELPALIGDIYKALS